MFVMLYVGDVAVVVTEMYFHLYCGVILWYCWGVDSVESDYFDGRDLRDNNITLMYSLGLNAIIFHDNLSYEFVSTYQTSNITFHHILEDEFPIKGYLFVIVACK